MKCKAVLLVTAPLLFATALSSLAQSPAVDWGPLNFLLGDWVGEGSSEVGQGTGGSSFSLDLQKRVMVRRNRAAYRATKDRQTYVHDDLMIIYRDSEKGPFRAIFFDNEGHVIHYAIQVSPDENSFQFLSDALPNRPRFRFTYTKSGPNILDINFEMAPPGKPDSFSQFIGGRIHRKE